MAAPSFATHECLRTTFFFQSPNRIMSMALYWQPNVPVAGMNGSTILNIANTAFNLAAPLFTELMDNACKLAKCRAEWWGMAGDGYWDAYSTEDAEDGKRGGVLDGEDIVGDVVGSVPDYANLVIQKRTGKQGRQTRGRVFFPCISEFIQENGVLKEDHFAAANSVAAFMSSDQEFDGKTFHARHWNQEDHKLEVIVQARVIQILSSRADRKPRGLRLPT